MRLELRGITKRFGPLVANDGIDLVFEPGRIHALLGENGAGKSTLMNTLYGLYQPDAGEILVDGEPRTFAGPGAAMAAGIGMVHQHFMLVPVFTVAENVVLGHEPVRGAGLLDLGRARRLVRDISDRFGFDVDPDALVEDLPVGVQQRVEIIKALSRDAEVLILDEPTAVLTPQETDELIAVMRRLREAGTSIVFITHKLREVRAVADDISVIRRGRVVGTATPDASEVELASLMVGRSVSLAVDKTAATPGEATFRVDGLTVLDPTGVPVVDDVTFEVRRGEILAIAGVQGNGQTELTETILGLRAPTAGSLTLDGVDLAGRPVADVLRAGVGFVPEDRTTDGLVASFSIAENLVLDLHDQAPYARRASLSPAVLAENAAKRVEEFDIRVTSVQDPVSTLSGGNQQKVVLAREMSRPLRLLVASQPTRGLDVGSIEFVHKRVVAERDGGTPVVIVSTELDEVLALADRIAVMYRGTIVGVVDGGPGADRDVLGLMMAGVPLEQARAQAARHHTALGAADAEAAGPEPATGGSDGGAAPADTAAAGTTQAPAAAGARVTDKEEQA
ncbi:ATP-binding cassette domain-containing protein [Cellulomonas sp. JZ18]|uniref:ABC transporter ATP-binding protein n=1 Tax=Cellulomonas sp. JZ18 TaxID=2654191 RepID=UPI0012D46B11|nr:ABC transporter ATP-binding protein [Cellulomonas sp. JZ18]QGQ20052.1 ATP-binding cassette domain-containing protein [Cellulomonas sp. JZ18]